jgi:peroxiredoxin
MKTTKIFAFAALICALFVRASNEEPGYKVGDKAKDFKLKNIDGKYVSLTDFDKAKGFIVVFTCNTCPFAVAYEDRIVALNNKYAAKGYPVIAINPNDVTKQPDDSFESMKKRAKQKNFTFPYLYDETQDIAKLYGASKTPHVYILSKSGADLVVEYIGAIDDNSYKPEEVKNKYAENALDELLQGKKISQTSTKAIGCTIKWKNS